MSISANRFNRFNRPAALAIAAVLALANGSAALAAEAEAAATDATVADAAAADASADDAADADGGLREIIVTAQKREENLQDTPIAISVMTGEGIENRHVQSLVDLGDGAIPSLRVAPFFSRPSALIINVRGVGVLSDSNQPARDQGVGVYVDGVYLGRPQALGAALFEVANIEVLKGPQGTLFGRNTEGGALNITTVRPRGEFRLDATAGIGNYGSYNGVVHLDLPSIGNISFKLDGILTQRDGQVRNPLAGASAFNSFDRRGIHAEALWRPSHEFTVDLSYDAGYDATTTLYQQLIGAPFAVAASTNDPAIAANIVAAAAPVQLDRLSVSPIGAIEQPSVGHTHGGRLNLEWQATPDLLIKSISAYRELTQSQYDNAGVASSFVTRPTATFTGATFQRYSLAFFRQNQVSEELQAIGEFGRVKYAFGALYYQERVEDSAQAPFVASFSDAAGSLYTVNPGAIATAVIQRASYVKTTSIGGYGQATYTPAIAGDIAHLTLGGRWTRDRKQGRLFIVNGALPAGINGNPAAAIPLDYTASRVDPLVNLSIDVSPDVHLYGKWSTGYKSGGANSRSLSYARFAPETVSMFEVGLKSEFFDRRVRLNVSAYTGTYRGIQLDFSGQYEDFVNGVRIVTTRTTTDTVNAPGTGRLKGIEAELTVAPTRGLTLSGSFAWNSVKIPDTVNPFQQRINGVNVTVTTSQHIYQVYTPEYSASGAIDYEVPLGGFTLKAHLDGNYDSGYYAGYTDVLIDTLTRAVRVAQPKGDTALVFNGRLALADIDVGNDGAKLTVSVWARNLFNEQHVFAKFASPTGGTTGFFNDFRTFGLDFNIKM
jgi:iron complex outermembrane receptor protein